VADDQPKPLKHTAQFLSARYSERAVLGILPEYAAGGPSVTVDGSPGFYSASFALARPGSVVYRQHVDFDVIALEGDSLLEIGLEPGLRLQGLTSDGMARSEFSLFPNSEGRLARVDIRVRAEDLEEASNRAYSYVAALLSWWSFRYDVAIEIAAWRITEEGTQTFDVHTGLLGRTARLDVEAERANVEVSRSLRLLLSAYRDGLTSTSPLHQVVCFWRVMEGVWARRRRDFEAPTAAGTTVLEASERVPNSQGFLSSFDPWQRQFIKPYQNKKFKAVREKLRSELRDAITHLDGEQPVVSADELTDLGKCESAIPILRYMARELLASEIQKQERHGSQARITNAVPTRTQPHRAPRRTHRGR
jgi:Methylamine utilization protein MauJ